MRFAHCFGRFVDLSCRPSSLALALLLSSLLAAGPVAGQAVTQLDAGIDLWETDVGAVTTVPGGFFCNGSPAWEVPLTSKKLLTDRPTETGNTDTIIERLEDAVFDDSFNPAQATTSIRVRALSMQSSSSLTVTCDNNNELWRVSSVCFRPEESDNDAFKTDLTIRRTHDQGGTFSGSLKVPARLTFTRDGDGAVLTLDQDVDFVIPSGTEPDPDWATAPGAGGLQVTDFVTVDANCDGILDGSDPLLPPTTNFHPGWDSSTSTTSPTTVVHSGPGHVHPVEVPDLGRTGGSKNGDCIDSVEADCGCDSTGTLSVSVSPDSPHAGLRNLSLASELEEPCVLSLGSVTEGGVEPTLCNERNLVVRQNGRVKGFEVRSVSPCVLHVGTPAQRAERRERLQRQ